MTDDKFSDEILTDEDLDGVVGGTCYENTSISMFVADNSVLLNRYKQYKRDYFPDGGSVAEKLTGFLSKELGIEANMNDSERVNNTYRDKATGKSMTHFEVCLRIMDFQG